MPVLDTEVFLGLEQREMGVPKEIMKGTQIPCIQGTLKRIVLTRFYRKPMVRQVPMLARSATPIGSLNATVSAEIFKTSRELETHQIEKILSQYTMRYGLLREVSIGKCPP